MAEIKHRAEAGFSLVELLTVLVILATLLSLAMPAYNSYLEKTRRSDAKAALLKLAAAEERWYFQNNQYTTSLNNIDTSSTLGTSPEGYYNITVSSVVPAQDFTLTATATGKQSGDTDCKIFKIDQTGDKTALDSGGNDNTANCW